MSAAAVVLCVGNPYRRDDGVGLAVLASLAALHDAVRAVEVDGEAASLLNAWAGVDRVVLVDAVSTGGAPGTVHLLQCADGRWGDDPPSAAASTHGLGLAAAVGLGSALGNLPRHLVLVGVEAGDTGFGLGLTEAVAAAVPHAVAEVLAAVA